MFIFDKCHHGLTVETPGKCENDSKELCDTFASSKFPNNSKTNKWHLLTPTYDMSSDQITHIPNM